MLFLRDSTLLCAFRIRACVLPKVLECARGGPLDASASTTYLTRVHLPANPALTSAPSSSPAQPAAHARTPLPSPTRVLDYPLTRFRARPPPFNCDAIASPYFSISSRSARAACYAVPGRDGYGQKVGWVDERSDGWSDGWSDD